MSSYLERWAVSIGFAEPLSGAEVTGGKAWVPLSCCWAVLLNHAASSSLWNRLCEAPLTLSPCRSLTGEANAVSREGGCIWFRSRAWEVHAPAQRRQAVLQSTSRALPPLEQTEIPLQDSDSPPSASSLCSPRQLTQTGGNVFISNTLHNLSWSCLSYWQLFPCSSLRLAAHAGRTSSALRFCLPPCADFLSANKVI